MTSMLHLKLESKSCIAVLWFYPKALVTTSLAGRGSLLSTGKKHCAIAAQEQVYCIASEAQTFG